MFAQIATQEAWTTQAEHANKDTETWPRVPGEAFFQRLRFSFTFSFAFQRLASLFTILFARFAIKGTAKKT